MSSNWTRPPHPLFKRVVIFLIDGLRQDFIFGTKGKEHMSYITQLIQKGTTHSFIATATAPTVTMPRIKVWDFIINYMIWSSIPPFRFCTSVTESFFHILKSSFKLLWPVVSSAAWHKEMGEGNRWCFHIYTIVYLWSVLMYEYQKLLA